jgi:hypothetical protein
MSSEVIACNLALSHVGHGKEIAALSERGDAAEACNLFYLPALDEMLRNFDWPFAKKVAALGLVSTYGDANHTSNDWTYAYRYPSDCLKLRRIQSGVRTDYRAARVSYEVMADEAGTLIMTDRENAIIEYTTTDARNPGRWSSDFLMAFSYRIAGYIAPRLAKGDPFKVGERAAQFMMMSTRKAQANAGNEVQPDQDPDGELVLSRY